MIIQRRVLDYLQTIPGKAQSIETVAAETGIPHDKTSQALADLARNPEMRIRRISRGVYRLDLDPNRVYPDVPEGGSFPRTRWHDGIEIPAESELDRKAKADWEAKMATPDLPTVHDWSKMRFVNGAEPPKFLRVLGTDRKGLILIQMPDGTVGRVEPL